MQITRTNLPYYLLGRGLVSAESLVDGDLMVVEVIRRNRNFKVLRRRAPGYFLKQVQTWDALSLSTLQCEAACYRLANSDADFSSLTPFLPRFYDYDPSRHVLILELLPEGENLSEYHRRLGAFPSDVAAEIARTLAACHCEAGKRNRDNPENTIFPKRVPWILTVDQLGSSALASISGANAELVGIVQRYPQFQQTLSKLRAEWSPASLIHGDIKWDNCILSAQDGKDGKPHLKLIDWELADFGDPGWDLGAVFQAYLSFWIFSMPAAPELPPALMVERAQYPLDSMQPAMREFWRAYAEFAKLTPQAARTLLRRSVQYGAARLIQTAYECMYFSAQATSNVLYLLQLSLNILVNPEDAIASLCGFEGALLAANV